MMAGCEDRLRRGVSRLESIVMMRDGGADSRGAPALFPIDEESAMRIASAAPVVARAPAPALMPRVGIPESCMVVRMDGDSDAPGVVTPRSLRQG